MVGPVGAVVVVVVLPLLDDPVTVSWEPAISSETVDVRSRLGSGTWVTGPLSTDGQRVRRLVPEGP